MRYNLILSITILLFFALSMTFPALSKPVIFSIDMTQRPVETRFAFTASNESSEEEGEFDEETVVV